MKFQAHKSVPLIAASALIMQQLDSTAVATALPSIADALGVAPVRLHSAITMYLLALGVFLPVSGWLADRFGARRVFCWAIGLFTVASLLCAASVNLTMLVFSRLLQGFGGALMLPTARLILVRSVPKSELVSALVLMSLPAVIGPAAGPLLGGFITSVSSWRWIFWINLPVGIAGIVFTLLFIEKLPSVERRRFDMCGFLLSGIGIGMLIFGLDSALHAPDAFSFALICGGIVVLGCYIVHARYHPSPLLDLRLFSYPTLRCSLLGGSLFRIGFGALPFMLPLLMQEVFGYSPLQSGAITFVSSIGAFGMRTVTTRILRRFGFRSVLLWNSLVASLSMAFCAGFTSNTSPAVMIVIIMLGGVFRALQFTSINTLAFADVGEQEMSHVTTLSQMAQRISQSVGVGTAAALLQLFSPASATLTNHAFSMSFIIVALVSSLSGFFFFHLPYGAGNSLTGKEG